MIRVALMALLLQQPDFEALYRQALADREKSLGQNAAKTVESARDLGLFLAGRGDYSAALPYIDQALTTTNTAEGATVLHNWAVALEQTNATLAERMYRLALRIREKTLPSTDIELAGTRLNLAELLTERDNRERESLAVLALTAFDRKPGLAEGRSGRACGLLGALLATKGDVPGAERMLRRAVGLLEKAHGLKSPETASALEDLADLLTQTGRASAARPLVERAQRIRSGAR